MFDIFLSTPHIGETEQALAAEALAANQGKPDLAMLKRFERELAAYTGFKHVAALSSGTAALHLAMLVSGIGKDDEVWTSSMTFMGGVSPIVFVGATPVFFDLTPESWTINVDMIEEELRRGRRPKAILSTDLYGQACDMDKLQALCDLHGIILISDAAETLGAFYKGRHAGHGAKAAALSFNVNKIITTFGGGALMSDDEAFIRRAEYFSTQARQPAIHYQHTEIGYNYRLSNVSAAIGVGQLQNIEARVARRRAIFSCYHDELKDVAGLAFMPEPEGQRSTRWLTCFEVDPKSGHTSQHLLETCAKSRIETRPLWKPMHMQPVFAHTRFVGPGLCERLFANGLCLPSGSAMTDAQQAHVIEVLQTALA
jgi:pyridoxal phosphate-dependent aminotransferase EpsN